MAESYEITSTPLTEHGEVEFMPSESLHSYWLMFLVWKVHNTNKKRNANTVATTKPLTDNDVLSAKYASVVAAQYCGSNQPIFDFI